MLSIIICSISPEKLEETRKNLTETIGSTEFEIMGYDNREDKFPIAKVYNLCAQKAQYDNLFFVHEDVRFKSMDWARIIEAKLKEPDCGVIGFAGSTVKPDVWSGWSIDSSYEVSHYGYVQHGVEKLSCVNITEEEQFKQVITLDGLGMFVRKDVWQAHPFDEKVLTGFHCYDQDFTLEIAKTHKNWCCWLDMVHLSNGSFATAWMHAVMKIHDEKWHDFLPMAIPGIELTDKEIRRINERGAWKFFKDVWRTVPMEELLPVWERFRSLPFSWWKLTKIWSGNKKLRKKRQHASGLVPQA